MRIMKLTILLLFIVFLISCNSSDNNDSSDLQVGLNNACTLENPLDARWMQKLKDSLHCGEYSCRVSILKNTYGGNTVFFTDITDPACNYQAHYFLYNCYGKMVRELTNEESTKYANEHGSESEVLFSCNERE